MTENIIYGSCAIAFSMLLLPETSPAARNAHSLAEVLKCNTHISRLMEKYGSGIIVMGLVTWYLAAGFISMFQVKLNSLPVYLHFIFFVLVLSAILVGCFSAKSMQMHPYVNYSVYSTSTFAVYILLRAQFLVVYELFFRGILLFACVEQVGLVIAILINILLYAIAHFNSNRKELIGTIPFGVLLSILTIWYNSVWPAVLLHLSLALSHEVTLLKKYRSFLKNIRL